MEHKSEHRLKAGQASPPHARRLARTWLALSAALLAVFVMVGPSFGQGFVADLQQTGSPSPTPTGPVGPSIAFLNPAASYDPHALIPPRDEDVPDPPKVSDRFDGVDRAYHLVAHVGAIPSNPIVEAYIRYGTATEITIGLLDRVAGTDTWERYWDIPDSLAEGAATLIVRLYSQTPNGIEEVASHEVVVSMQHKGDAPPTPPDAFPADETVEITWPTNTGPLGFFRSKGGSWRTAIDGFASSRAEYVSVFYTTSPPGAEPEYKSCAPLVDLWNTPEYDTGAFGVEIPFTAPCTLDAKDSASSVTGVAMVTLETDQPERNESITGNEVSQDSADAHRVTPYIQDPSRMTVSVDPNANGQQPFARRRTAGPTTTSSPPGGCLAYLVTVTDHLGRPVQSANVDVHIQGPGDQVQFGGEDTTGSGARASGGRKVPDEGSHTQEPSRNCDPTGDTNPPAGRFLAEDQQGDHNIPGGPDLKHRESTAGTGPGGGSNGSGRPPPAGQWRFHIFSENPGRTEITAWLDSPAAPATGDPAADDDVLSQGEPFATDFAQWYASNPIVDITPTGGVGATGSCFEYTAKVRSGNVPVPGINVDVHAKGPNDELDFCDPGEATPRRAPDRGPAENAGPHQPEDEGEVSHVEQSPRTQHTEGEADANGNFVFGVTSPVVGDTTITTWVDGERSFYNSNTRKDSDNDIQAAGEPNRTVTHSWATAGEARISFVNPSGYGGSGDNVAKKTDADTRYHLVARVEAVGIEPGVEFLISSSATGPFTKIGDATRLGTSDAYELLWDVNVADGPYTIRAQVTGTNTFVDRSITVNNTPPSPADPRDVPFETVEIISPTLGTTASFSRGALSIQGVASTGADGVDLFYTKVSARDTAASAQWILCGFVDLAGGAAAPQGFKGDCTLTAPDQPSQVTGIAAIAVDCTVQNNCDARIVSGQPRQATRHSGDAHRVFGLEANPLISIEPAEAQETPGTCQRLVLSVIDQTGQPMGDLSVDVHATGPTDDIHFCNPNDGSSRRAPDQGGHAAVSDEPTSGFHQSETADTHHTEGETSSSGRFIFGVTSPNEGDTEILGWVDVADNDERGTDENGDTSVLHWAGELTEERRCTISGTPGNDRLTGTDDDDVICGRGGDDTLIGAGGNDLLLGGRGRDSLDGGPGNDELRGSRGPDTLVGGAGEDLVIGGRRSDVMRGAGGADTLRGDDGHDTIKGGSGNDSLSGGPGNDRLDGGRDNDACRGGPGRDRIRRCEEGSRTAGRARAL